MRTRRAIGPDAMSCDVWRLGRTAPSSNHQFTPGAFYGTIARAVASCGWMHGSRRTHCSSGISSFFACASGDLLAILVDSDR